MYLLWVVEGEEWSRETPPSRGEKGVIVLSSSITVTLYTHTHTRTHRKGHTTANVYKHRHVIMLIRYTVAAPTHTHAHLHLYTGDGSSLRWSPVGAVFFCTGTCHLDHANLHSPPFSLSLSHSQASQASQIWSFCTYRHAHLWRCRFPVKLPEVWPRSWNCQQRELCICRI